MTSTCNKNQDMQKLKLDVETTFDKIREALNVREKLLLRQIDVIVSSQLYKSTKQYNGVQTHPPSPDQEVKLLTENENELLSAIRSFGKFNIDNLHSTDVYMKSEDYIAPGIDHEIMYKGLGNDNKEVEQETIAVDFSRNKKLIEENVSTMNESIINITLNEAKHLILKAARNSIPVIPELNLKDLSDEMESSYGNEKLSIASEEENYLVHDSLPTPPNTKSSQTENTLNRKQRTIKPKITINNCNGTINLKNISNLTINCATEEAVSAEIPLPDESSEEHKNSKPKVPSTSSTSPSVSISTSSSSGGSKNDTKRNQIPYNSNKVEPNRQNAATNIKNNNSAFPFQVQEEDTGTVNCEFYNRLINEIKNSLKQKSKLLNMDNRRFQTSTSSTSHTSYDNDQNSNTHCNSHSHSNVTATSSHCDNNKEKKLILRNFENLKIILESKDDGTYGTEQDGSGNLHPVQIEQWLAEIISETEIEPMQNTDILEHSKIHNEV